MGLWLANSGPRAARVRPLRLRSSLARAPFYGHRRNRAKTMPHAAVTMLAADKAKLDREMSSPAIIASNQQEDDLQNHDRVGREHGLSATTRHRTPTVFSRRQSGFGGSVCCDLGDVAARYCPALQALKLTASCRDGSGAVDPVQAVECTLQDQSRRHLVDDLGAAATRDIGLQQRTLRGSRR